jgi:translation initiation factor eIF-2B subunit epsilon
MQSGSPIVSQFNLRGPLSSASSFSKDILARWTFPLTPDNNHPGGHAYEHLRGNKYIAKDNSVVLAR